MKEPPEQTKSNSNHGPKLLSNQYPNDLPLPSARSTGGQHPDILDPSRSNEPEPFVVGGDGTPGSDHNNESSRGGQGGSPLHPNTRVPSPLSLIGNAPCYGDLQRPCMDVHSDTSTTKLRGSIFAILPYPIMGDSILASAVIPSTANNPNGYSDLSQ